MSENKMEQKEQDVAVLPPKFVQKEQWEGYSRITWTKKEKKDATVMFNLVERRKSFFFKAFLQRNGFKCHDMGDHVKEDVQFGKAYGNRMECNPMYFTSGSLIRNLLKIEAETGLSKDEIVKQYVFLCGGGQCGPCRYGMYPQEYLKVANDAGFKDFRILIFSSDLGDAKANKESALPFNLMFRINLIVAVILADLLHMAECAIRPYAKDSDELDNVLKSAEDELYQVFLSKRWFWKLKGTLKKVGARLAAIEKRAEKLPLIFVTGEFFANLAHNDGNYHLRRFIADEGCEVLPGSFTQRVLYDNWRRTVEGHRGLKYAADADEAKMWKKSIKKQTTSSKVVVWLYKKYFTAMNPEAFGGKGELLDLDELAELAREYYHPEIFGGEGNLEIAEAIHYANNIDGFISSKPFGCMPSSGVSDGVQAKIMSLYPEHNFLSIETSGDNDVNILSRVSMLLFKAKQKVATQANNSSDDMMDAYANTKEYCDKPSCENLPLGACACVGVKNS